MPTVTDIPQEECALFDENPTLIKFDEAMGASRFVRMTAIYLLRETLEAAPREAHEDICLAFAEKGGMSVEVLKTDLRWAMKIEQADLLTALEREAITPTDWAASRTRRGSTRTRWSPVGGDHLNFSLASNEDHHRRLLRYIGQQPGKVAGPHLTGVIHLRRTAVLKDQLHGLGMVGKKLSKLCESVRMPPTIRLRRHR